MRIGIISDTHIKKDLSKLYYLLDNSFKGLDLIIHAGDYVNTNVIETLKSRTKFTGVWGNNDSAEVRQLVEEKEILTLEGYKIGIFHGHGDEGHTPDRAFKKFKDDQVDIIIFGHSHQPLIRTKRGVLILNPGSLTNKRRERWFSCIILELSPENIDVQLKLFHKKK